MLRVECDVCGRLLKEDEKNATISAIATGDGSTSTLEEELMADKECYDLRRGQLKELGFDLPAFDKLFED